jgi:glycosyltransferase involved in cell wall biosynthesis
MAFPVVAYIMKGYPRLSETFILNEIQLLESMGLRLHIFSVKGGDKTRHPIVARIQAGVTYTPEDTSSTDATFGEWLAKNLPRYGRSQWRLMWKRPKQYWQTLFYTLFGLSLSVSFGRLPFWKRAFLKDFLRAGYIALQVIEDGRIGHLHGHFCHGSTTITMLVSHLTGIPYSFTAHAKDIYLPKLNPGDLLAVKIEKATFVATCTDANRVYLEQLNHSRTPIYTIYHGLDTGLFQRERPIADNPPTPTILAVGRFVAKKGFDYLVEACRILHEQGYDFYCRIVGEPDEQTERIEGLIRAYGLEHRFTLQGGVTQTELKEIYEEATLFALPCHIIDSGDRDGIPNVLVEAMMMELPVVSSNISGIPELVTDRVNGLLVPQKEPVALAAALAELLDNPGLRRQLGQAARQTVSHSFDARQTTVALHRLLTTCLERYQPAGEPQTVAPINRPLVQPAQKGSG